MRRRVRGFFGVGIYHPKSEVNVGTLWRSASIFGASYIFTVGRRYEHQSSDVAKTPRHVPLFSYQTMDDLASHLPHGCPLIGVEMTDDARDLADFTHPDRACYLLGAEDRGLPCLALERCHSVVRLPGPYCLNVAVVGSIVLYDRVTRGSAAWTESLLALGA